MLKLIDKWEGAIEIDGTLYDNYNCIPRDLTLHNSMTIILHSQEKRSAGQIAQANSDMLVISVKQYMTKKATPEFDFMLKWNNDIPMPLMTMVGTIEKETRGMVYMKLHGELICDEDHRCMKCGRAITNPVSKYFGMGPECGGHNYTHPFETDEDLQEALSNYKSQLKNITWEGWIIKSAITRQEEYNNGNTDAD